ncbi:carbon starvation CstA family protein [Shigella flexneri]
MSSSRAGVRDTRRRYRLCSARRPGRHDGCGVLVSLRHSVEALFLLTAVDAGTLPRALCCRICWAWCSWPDGPFPACQPARHRTVRTGVGLLPASGVVDPLGGIDTLWPLFGTPDQMLAGMALVSVPWCCSS